MGLRLCYFALLPLLVACSSSDKPADEGAAPGDVEERVDARAPSSSDASSRRDAGDAARPTTTTPPSTDGEGCASVSARAEAKLLPVDIVWAIDTSGSMTASFPAIQQALTSFSQQVSEAGIDAHIVLLAGAGLCVPAPLGSGTCGVGLGGGIGLPGGLVMPGTAPDTKQPNFLHLDVSFGYTQGVPQLLGNYEFYKNMLRAGARTHLVVTEDGPSPLGADDVIAQVQGGSWQPGLAPDSWSFHGVVCQGVGAACLLSLAPPVTTLELIERTGGIAGDLALAGGAMDPFSKLLDELAARVIVGAELSCEYDIPAVPQGETFDRNKVNVATGTKTLPQAKSGACGDNQAWSYDDDANPAKIVLCPSACDAVRAEADAKLDVQFGCQTVTLI